MADSRRRGLGTKAGKARNALEKRPFLMAETFFPTIIGAIFRLASAGFPRLLFRSAILLDYFGYEGPGTLRSAGDPSDAHALGEGFEDLSFRFPVVFFAGKSGELTAAIPAEHALQTFEGAVSDRIGTGAIGTDLVDAWIVGRGFHGANDGKREGNLSVANPPAGNSKRKKETVLHRRKSQRNTQF